MSHRPCPYQRGFCDTFRYGVKNKECTRYHWAENTAFAVQNQEKYREYTWFISFEIIVFYLWYAHLLRCVYAEIRPSATT